MVFCEYRIVMVKNVDDVDRRLLRLLREDGRRPWTELADELGVSEGTVRSRVADLREDDVIRRFTVEVDGGLVEAIVAVDVATNVDTGDVTSQVSRLEDVRDAWEVASDVDLFVRVDAADPADLDDTVEALRSVDGVLSTRSHVVLKRS